MRASAAIASDRGDLHRLVDRGGGDIQRAAEDERETQDVVDLVGIVAAPGGDDGVGPRRGDQLRQDLRIGIGQRQDQRLRRQLRAAIPASARAAPKGPGRHRRPPARRAACARRCRGHSAPCSAACPARSVRTTPLMSVSVTFSGRSPIDTSRSTQASAAAPAPEVTSFDVGQRLALQHAARCAPRRRR